MSIMPKDKTIGTLKIYPSGNPFFDHRDRQEYDDGQKKAIGECSCEIVDGHLRVIEWGDTTEEIKSLIEESQNVIENDIRMGCQNSVLDKFEWVIEY